MVLIETARQPGLCVLSTNLSITRVQTLCTNITSDEITMIRLQNF